MNKQPNAFIEFGLVLGLIAVAVVFGFHFNFNLWSLWPDKKAVSPQERQAEMADTPQAISWRQGKELFKNNCAACHNLKSEGTGPALQGVTKRWQAAGNYQGKTGKEWLDLWIKNWNEPVKAGYKYAIEMANSRPAQMNVFPLLSTQDVDLILNYVEQPDSIRPAS